MAAVSMKSQAPGRHDHRGHLGHGHGVRHHPDRSDARLQRGPDELPLRQHPHRARIGPCDHVGDGAIDHRFVAVYYKDLLALSYDEEFARIRGVPVVGLYFALIGMLSVTIVLVIQVVGLILVIALLTIPPFIARKARQVVGCR
jgi:hypothetical protein